MKTMTRRYSYQGRDIRICPRRAEATYVFTVMMDGELLEIEPPLPSVDAAMRFAEALIDDEN